MRITLPGGPLFSMVALIVVVMGGVAAFFGGHDDSRPAVARQEILEICSGYNAARWSHTTDDRKLTICRRWLGDRIEPDNRERLDWFATRFVAKVDGEYRDRPSDFENLFELLRAKHWEWMDELDP